MNKRLLPAVLAAVLLLAGCSQEPVPYDYDLSAYIELGTYSAIPYLPYGDTGRDTVEPYDLVTAELEAAVEGVETPFRGTYTFEVGYSNFLEGFDDALIGLRVGEPATVRLVFPDPYEEQPEFSGRNVEIEVLVTAIDFSQYVETNKNTLWEIAVDTSTVLQYPEAELREYEEDFRECYLAFAREYGMELDDYLRQFFGTNEEGLDALCRKNAQDSVKRDLVMYGILRAENLEITQEDLEACKPDWLITYGYEREAPKGWEDPGVQESLRAMAALRKAQEFVYEHAEPQSA